MKVGDKTCIFFFFPIINKYFLMAKRSLISRLSAPLYSHSKLPDHTDKSYGSVHLEKLEMPFPAGFMLSINVLDQAINHTADRKITDVAETE